MSTLVLKVNDTLVANKIMAALSLFKGVKDITLLSEEQLENSAIVEACKEARKTPKVSKATILKALA